MSPQLVGPGLPEDVQETKVRQKVLGVEQGPPSTKKVEQKMKFYSLQRRNKAPTSHDLFLKSNPNTSNKPRVLDHTSKRKSKTLLGRFYQLIPSHQRDQDSRHKISRWLRSSIPKEYKEQSKPSRRWTMPLLRKSYKKCWILGGTAMLEIEMRIRLVNFLTEKKPLGATKQIRSLGCPTPRS